MRYLITRQQELFTSDAYTCISIEQSLEMLSKGLLWGLDIETRGFDPYTKEILSVQIGNEENQFIIDTSSVDITIYKDFFEHKDRIFILQNAKFDLRFFYHKRIIIKKVYDTFLAEKLLYLGYPAGMFPMSLDALTERYLGITLDKSVRADIAREGLSTRVIIYGCDDVKYLIPLMNLQLERLKKDGLLTAINIENRFVPVLAYVEYCGIKLDEKKWKDKMDSDRVSYNTSKKALDDWVVNHGDNRFINQNLQGDLFLGFSGPTCSINWASSKQVIPLLESLGFELLVKDKDTGRMKKSVEGPIIDMQKEKSTIAPLYLEFKKHEKVVSTYGQSFIDAINPISGRIHTQFNQLMDTTRLSSGGKDLDTGQDNINFQNIPSDEITRACFVAEEGCVLVDADYTAQEDLVFTEASQESKLIEFYNDTTRKRDGHSFVAKMCFPEELDNIPEEDVKHLFPDLRGNSKKAKFAIK